MKLTEDEARARKCHRRLRDVNGPISHEHGYCIASECMAWRFSGFLEKGEECPVSGITVQEHTPTGYCGLAGKPS